MSINHQSFPTVRSHSPEPGTETSGSRGRSSVVEAEPAVSLLEVLLAHRGKLLACLALGLCLGVAYQMLATRIYESSAEIFVERSKDGQPQSPLSPGGVSAGLPSTHAALLVSVPVLKGALADPELANLQTFASQPSEDDRIRYLKEHIDVSFAKEIETVSVGLKGEQRQEIATIVNAVIKSYLRQLQVPLASAAGVAIDPRDAAGTEGILGDRLAEARLMRLSDELTAAQNQFENASIRLHEAEAAEGDLSRIAVQLDDLGVSGETYGLGELSALTGEWNRLQQQLQSMPKTWGREHALRAPVQRQVDAIASAIQDRQQRARESMVSLLRSAQKNAAERVEELSARIADEQARAAVIAKLPVRVMEWAQLPGEPVAPRGLKSIGIAMFLSLAGGIAMILWSELKPAAGPLAESAAGDVQEPASAAIMRSEDVEEALQEVSPPILGTIPEAPSGRRLTSPNFDATASSIHQIRAVLHIQAGKRNARAFAFTSPRRGAGKTSVTIGVASSLAMSGTRTLVVDCDLAGRIARGQTGAAATRSTRRVDQEPQTTDAFGPIEHEGTLLGHGSLDNIVIEEGFVSENDSHVLSSTMDEIRAGVTGMLDGGSLEECVVNSTVDGLSLLPAVHAQTRHIGKMSDAFIRRLIEEARGSYDLVLFDTGPVPGSVEALLTTSQADGVVIVVPQGESSAALTRTMSYLKVVGARVCGTVFNRANPAAATSGPAEAGTQRHHHAEAAKSSDPQSSERGLDDADDDLEFLDGDAPLGSGILAAAVFSDAESGYANDNWKLKDTSEFHGSVGELFGHVDSVFADDTSERDDQDAPDSDTKDR